MSWSHGDQFFAYMFIVCSISQIQEYMQTHPIYHNILQAIPFIFFIYTLSTIQLAPIHNITHNLNNVMWDWQYYVKYSSHLAWIWGIFHIILSVPQNIVLDLNNVCHHSYTIQLIVELAGDSRRLISVYKVVFIR